MAAPLIIVSSLIGLVLGRFLVRAVERLAFAIDWDEMDEERDDLFSRIPVLGLFLAMPRYCRFGALRGEEACPGCGERMLEKEPCHLMLYLFGGRRCRLCGFRFPWRYALIEICAVVGTASAAVLLLQRGLYFTFSFMVMFSLFLVAAVVDLKFQIIPDEVSVAGIAAGLFGALGVSMSAWLHGSSFRQAFLFREGGVGWALAGLLAGASALLVVYHVGTWLAGTEAMGGGDVKLAGFIGTFLGASGVLVALFLSTFLGAAGGIAIKIAGGGIREGGFTKFAFGPYICAGALITHLVGVDAVLGWYAELTMRVTCALCGVPS